MQTLVRDLAVPATVAPRRRQAGAAEETTQQPGVDWSWPVPRRRELVVLRAEAIGGELGAGLDDADALVAFVLEGLPNGVAAALLALPHLEELTTAGRTWVNPTPAMRDDLVRRVFGATTPAGVTIDVRLAVLPAATTAAAVPAAERVAS